MADKPISQKDWILALFEHGLSVNEIEDMTGANRKYIQQLTNRIKGKIKHENEN